ncbi:hypothetical protein [Rhizobium sp. PP-F2F-G48]|uniref:hypothetical protein n=1 Tax=Rhizobium sp. PP-F2F-G48 TaxID=2135651 RepID=UPI0010454716|nr:hypothetical protein [Rhizobium sp. PP-F2F-G48]
MNRIIGHAGDHKRGCRQLPEVVLPQVLAEEVLRAGNSKASSDRRPMSESRPQRLSSRPFEKRAAFFSPRHFPRIILASSRYRMHRKAFRRGGAGADCEGMTHILIVGLAKRPSALGPFIKACGVAMSYKEAAIVETAIVL